MANLYPAIEPYVSGMLSVGDGQELYWEECGNPEGASVVVLHGGPGSGCTPTARRYFDPSRYRIVLFDQRGCGRSLPHAASPTTSLSSNTTHHLGRDIETLRIARGIERWMVFGQSWGSTLGIAYAEQHPDRVSAMVLGAVVTTTRREISWLTEGIGLYFPEAWESFEKGAPGEGSIVERYYRLLNDPDAEVRAEAAQRWCDWEEAIVNTGTDHQPSPRYDDARFRACFARLVTHYFHHAAWLEEGELLANADRLRGIPGMLVHGRLDIGSPLGTAYELAKRWPDAELVVVETAGHDARDTGMAGALVAATNRFAGE